MDFEALSRVAREEALGLLAELPAEVRSEVEAVPLFLERVPEDPELDPELLGLFDPGPPQAAMPRIRLWLENLWDYANCDARVFREEVRTTLLHEIGHLLGWDEEELEARGLD